MSNFLVSLPMYDFPFLEKATDAWWEGIRKHLLRQGIHHLPSHRTRPKGDLVQHWQLRSLVFSQTCGYPLVSDLSEQIELLWTPGYDLPECESGEYFSYLLMREGNPKQNWQQTRELRLAVNGINSHSGWNVFRHMFSLKSCNDINKLFKEILITGSHEQSIQALKDNIADIAAIDAVSYQLMKNHSPEGLNGLVIVAESKKAPCLPYVTSYRFKEYVGRMKEGLYNAVEDKDLQACRTDLLITSFHDVPLSVYQQKIL